MEPFKLPDGTWVAYIPNLRDPTKRKRIRIWKHGAPDTPRPSQRNRKRAREKLKQIMSKLDAEAKLGLLPEGDLTLEQAMMLALKDRGCPRGERDGLAPSSLEVRKNSLRRFVAFVGPEVKARSVKGIHVEHFLLDLEEKGYRHAGIARQRTCVRRMFNYLIESDVLPEGFANPVKRRRQGETGQGEPFTEAEERLIFETIERGYTLGEDGKPDWYVPAWLGTMTWIARYSGMRSGEIRQLTWSDVDLDEGWFAIRAEVAKSGKPRDVPILPQLEPRLGALHAARESVHLFRDDEGRLIRKERVSKTTRAFLDALRIPGRCFHSWRHTFGYWAAERLPLHTVKEIMGHSTVKVTEGYLKGGEIRERGSDIRQRLGWSVSEQRAAVDGPRL